MMLINLSKKPDLRFAEIVHTGIEDRDNQRSSQIFSNPVKL
jgi:hypothetical protein